MTTFSTRGIFLLIMSDALTARQTQILKALIDEYIETAFPVGSENLDKKYNLGVSPATIRNEMAALTKMGYLKQPYTSAGRVPTPVAMKFYIDQLMEEKQMSLADEVKTKEDVWDSRANFDKFMGEATEALAEKTQALAVSATDSGDSWSAGYSNVFANPEFSDLSVCRSVFELLEEQGRLHELFFERLTGITPIEVLFGEELHWPYFEPIGIVATRFSAGGHQGALGIIGPFRLNYPSVIPTLKYFRNLIEEVVGK